MSIEKYQISKSKGIKAPSALPLRRPLLLIVDYVTLHFRNFGDRTRTIYPPDRHTLPERHPKKCHATSWIVIEDLEDIHSSLKKKQ